MFVEPRYADDEPQLHALIIGVGHYPHSGGNDPLLRQLGNLRSPNLSALRLAQWLRDHEGWLSNAKLGSVDLLVSDQPNAAPAGAETLPTLYNIEQAFETWFDRCHRHPDNIAFFSFCGHGFKKDATLLLPQDFGKLKRSLWARALDFDALYNNMATCQAKTQCFIIDACRVWNSSMLADLSVSGVALGTADIRQRKDRTAPKLFAAASGQPAFGDLQGGPSRMTGALIQCLEGKAAVKENGRWHVSTDNLGKAVKTLLENGNRHRRENEQQIVDPDGGEAVAGPRRLVTLPIGHHPCADVEFVCDRDEATGHAAFYHKGVAPASRRRKAKKRGLWATSMPAGMYHCGAEMRHPRFRPQLLENEPILPPMRRISVEVTEHGSSAGDCG